MFLVEDDSGQSENENCLVHWGLSVGLSSLKAKRCRGTNTLHFADLSISVLSTVTSANRSIQIPFNMPPKKKVERAATENISLGPQVREGELYICPSFRNADKPFR